MLSVGFVPNIPITGMQSKGDLEVVSDMVKPLGNAILAQKAVLSALSCYKIYAAQNTPHCFLTHLIFYIL